MRVVPAFALGVLGGIVIGIGRIFGLLEMYVIGTGLFTAACAAVITTRSRVVLIDVQREPTSRQPHVGDDIGVDITLRAVRRSPGFEFSDIIADSSRTVLGRVDMTVPPLRRGQQTVSRYRLHADRRGVITLGPAKVVSSDPLGLSTRTTSTGVTDEIVVSPRWVPIALPVVDDCDGELVTALKDLARNSTSEREFRSLREYVPGDDIRIVNWRATARRDSLIVNEHESRSAILLDVHVDDASHSYSTEGFERAVSIAASFVGSADSVDEQDIRVRLSFGSRRDETAFDAMIDDDTRRDAMRALALLDPSDRPSQPHASSDRTAVSIPVIICGARDGEWISRVHRSLRGSSVAVVINCDGPAPQLPSALWFALTVQDFSSFERQWSQLCRRITSS